MPATEHIKSSEVLSQLNKEALQTKAEMDKEVRKWSTFLQKPDRPIPIRKTIVDIQRETNSYKVHIVKQPKPRVDPNRTPTPPPTPDAFEQAVAEITEKQEPQEDISRPDTSLSSQTDVRNFTDLEEDSLRLDTTDAEDTDEKSLNDNDDNRTEQNDEEKEQANSENTAVEQEQVKENVQVTIQKTEEEIYLEKQLKEVQNQLMALSNLPFTIQAALNEVTLKLSSIVPQIAQVKEKKFTPEATPEETPEREEKIESQIITNGSTEEATNEEEGLTTAKTEVIKLESTATTIETISSNTNQKTINKTSVENQETSKTESEASELVVETENEKYQEWQYEKNEVNYFQT